MTAPVVALVLLAAIMHAGWNALLRGGHDRMTGMAVMCLGSLAISAAMVPWLPLPEAGAWGPLLLSAVLHLGYNLFLVAAYRYGDLGEVYPIARGASPLLVAIGAALFASEAPGPLTNAGIALVSLGIMALALRRGRALPAATLVPALITGIFIAAYTVTDGIGGRASGNAYSYAAWLSLIDGWPIPLWLALTRRRAFAGLTRKQVSACLGGGAVSFMAYALVIWAQGRASMGAVSALRETSVVFAALLGRFMLSERLTLRRISACLVIAGGAALLALKG